MLLGWWSTLSQVIHSIDLIIIQMAIGAYCTSPLHLSVWFLGRPFHPRCVHGQVHKIDFEMHHQRQSDEASECNIYFYFASLCSGLTQMMRFGVTFATLT